MAFARTLTNDERSELHRFAEPLRRPLADFVSGRTTADEFEGRFLKCFPLVRGIPTAPVAAALDEMFFAVDDYVGHGMVVEPEEGDIDSTELLVRARRFMELAGYPSE